MKRLILAFALCLAFAGTASAQFVDVSVGRGRFFAPRSRVVVGASFAPSYYQPMFAPVYSAPIYSAPIYSAPIYSAPAFADPCSVPYSAYSAPVYSAPVFAPRFPRFGTTIIVR